MATETTRWPWGYAYAAVAMAAFLAAVLGGLHLYRALESAKEQFLKRAALSAQVFAESAVAAGRDEEALRRVTQAFVRGDVLYAQVVWEGSIRAEERVEAALELDLPVERGFPGRLVVREGRLRDGMPYVEVLRPFTGMSPEQAREALSYVRVGISLREVDYEWRGEVLLTVGVGLGAVAFVALLVLGVGLRVRPRPPAPGSGYGGIYGMGRESAGESWVRVGALTLDLQAKEVRYRGEKVELSPKEYELLRVLAAEPGRVFSTQEILERVWTNVPGATAKDVKQYIYLLRRKLERHPERPQLIVTVRGFGYKLVPLEPESDSSEDRRHSDDDQGRDPERRNREDGRKPSKSRKEGDRR